MGSHVEVILSHEMTHEQLREIVEKKFHGEWFASTPDDPTPEGDIETSDGEVWVHLFEPKEVIITLSQKEGSLSLAKNFIKHLSYEDYIVR